MYGITKPWIFSLLLQILFAAIFLLNTSQTRTYELRGFWGLLSLPICAFVVAIVSWVALARLKLAPLPNWKKNLILLLHLPLTIFSSMMWLGFLLLILSGMISPSDYAYYASPSGQRSVTIISHNITCTQQVYLNHGLIMQSVDSFQIGTAKCLKSAKAKITWQSEETALIWHYGDRQGIIQLPKD
jgi:hypothetical protein